MPRNLHDEFASWEDWPPARKPKPGEMLIAFIDGDDIGHTTCGPVHTVMVTQVATNTKLTIWLSSIVLLSLSQRHQLRPGEKISVKYLGKDPEKGYHRYRIVVDRSPGRQNFRPLGGEEDASPWDRLG